MPTDDALSDYPRQASGRGDSRQNQRALGGSVTGQSYNEIYGTTTIRTISGRTAAALLAIVGGARAGYGRSRSVPTSRSLRVPRVSCGVYAHKPPFALCRRAATRRRRFRRSTRPRSRGDRTNGALDRDLSPPARR